jgi:hypothetical protein
VVVDQGRVTHTGTYHQLLAQGVDLSQYSVQTQGDSEEDQAADDQPSDQEAGGAAAANNNGNSSSSGGENSSGVLFSLGEEEEGLQAQEQQQKQQKPQGDGAESMQHGVPTTSVEMNQRHALRSSSRGGATELPNGSSSSSSSGGSGLPYGSSSSSRGSAAVVSSPAGAPSGPSPTPAAAADSSGQRQHLAVDLLGLISDAATASDPGGSGSGAGIQAVADAAVSAGVLLGQSDDVAALVDAHPAAAGSHGLISDLVYYEDAGGGVSLAAGDSSSRGLNLVSEQRQVQDSSSSLVAYSGHSSSSSSSKRQTSSPALVVAEPPGSQPQSGARDDAESETQALLKRLTTQQDGQTDGQPDGQLVKAEERAKGQVTWQVYKTYMTAWGPWLLLPLALVGSESLGDTT